MKKLTYRQKRDFLDKCEWLITCAIQIVSALCGAICGILICHFLSMI